MLFDSRSSSNLPQPQQHKRTITVSCFAKNGGVSQKIIEYVMGGAKYELPAKYELYHPT
jgi:hypothetical protein